MNEFPNEDILPSAPKAATKKEFLQLPENKKFRKGIRGMSILCYICAGLTFVVCLMAGNYAGIIDVLLLLATGLSIHLRQSLAGAIILTVYSIFNFILALSAGSGSGGAIVVIGVISICHILQFNKAWKAYRGQ